jgi:hypothetical protein
VRQFFVQRFSNALELDVLALGLGAGSRCSLQLLLLRPRLAGRLSGNFRVFLRVGFCANGAFLAARDFRHVPFLRPLQGAELVFEKLALFEGVLVVLGELALLAENFVRVVAPQELEPVREARFRLTCGLLWFCVVVVVVVVVVGYKE